MMNTRQSPRSTRIDLRIPNDLLETVQELARTRFNAPIHHISGKPEITPVIVQLIQLGIGTLSGQTEDLPVSRPDTYPDNIVTVARLETAIESLRSESGGEKMTALIDRLDSIERASMDTTARVDTLDRAIAEIRSTLSSLQPPANTAAGEGDRLNALENRTEEMMRTLLELQEAVSIARREDSITSIKNSSGTGSDDSPSPDTPAGDFSESSPQKSRERATRESPKSQDRPTFTTDLSIDEIRSKLETGEGLTHAEFIEWNGLKASPRTVADWPTKMRAGEVAPRAYPNLQNEWEYRRERWFPIDSDGQTADQ